jgi:hypothetical protein
MQGDPTNEQKLNQLVYDYRYGYLSSQQAIEFLMKEFRWSKSEAAEFLRQL